MAQYCLVYSPYVDLEALRPVLDKHQVEAVCLKLTANLGNQLKKQHRAGCRIFIAGGGDGTVNAVINALSGVRYQLGILPLGTHNHLAADLKLPLDVEEALKVIIKAKTKRIDVGMVNQQLFVNNSSIGVYPRLVKRRRGSRKLTKRFWDLVNLPVVLSRPARYRVELKIGQKQVSYRSSLIFIGNNSYKIRRWGLSNRDSLTGGQLCLYFIKSRNGFKVTWVYLKAVLGRLSGETAFGEYFASEINVNTQRPKFIKVALDGEVKRLKTPLKYEIRPRSLTVIVP